MFAKTFWQKISQVLFYLSLTLGCVIELYCGFIYFFIVKTPQQAHYIAQQAFLGGVLIILGLVVRFFLYYYYESQNSSNQLDWELVDHLFVLPEAELCQGESDDDEEDVEEEEEDWDEAAHGGDLPPEILELFEPQDSSLGDKQLENSGDYDTEGIIFFSGGVLEKDWEFVSYDPQKDLLEVTRFDLISGQRLVRRLSLPEIVGPPELLARLHAQRHKELLAQVVSEKNEVEEVEVVDEAPKFLTIHSLLTLTPEEEEMMKEGVTAFEQQLLLAQG